MIDLAAGTTVVAKSAFRLGRSSARRRWSNTARKAKRLASEVSGATGAAMPLGVATSTRLRSVMFASRTSTYW